MGIPTDSIEASIIDGANYWQKLRYIYIPQIYSFYCHGNGNMPDRFFRKRQTLADSTKIYQASYRLTIYQKHWRFQS